jgi:hypothetical protein
MDTLKQCDASISQLLRDIDTVRAALATEKMRVKGKSRPSTILVLCCTLPRLDIC